MENYKELLTKILLKKAKGYLSKEKTEEFTFVDGERVAVKQRITTKRVPPDVSAIKALLEMPDGEIPIAEMTDEQLQSEKLRLIRLLEAVDSGADKTEKVPTETD